MKDATPRRRKLGSMKDVSAAQDGTKWQLRLSKGVRRDGTRRTWSKTIEGTRGEAEALLARTAASMGIVATVGDPMTVSEYFWGHFLPDRLETTTKANARTHANNFTNHIEPWFGDADISTITNLDVQEWISHLPPQSAPNYARTARAMFAQAHFDHVIDASPMQGYRFRYPRGRDTSPRPVWGAYDVLKALDTDAFVQDPIFPLWAIMTGAGLSRSEALALDWDDLEWREEAEGDATHRVCLVPVKSAYTSLDGMKEPKNSRRYRVSVLAPLFADRLWTVRGTGPVCQSTRYTKGGGYLTGRRMTPDRVPDRWNRLFGAGMPLEGFAHVPIGRMRATFSTLMQGAGVDSTLINAMQGRSDNSQVLYANYLSPQVDSYLAAATAMQRRIKDDSKRIID